MLGIVKIVGSLKKANGTAHAQEEEAQKQEQEEEKVSQQEVQQETAVEEKPEEEKEVEKEVWEEEEIEKEKIPLSKIAVKSVKDQIEKMKIEMLQVPKNIRVDNLSECYEVLAKMGQSIVRSKVIVKICESASALPDVSPVDRTQLEYYKEVAKVHIRNVINSAQKFIDSLKAHYPEDSFEINSLKALFDTLRKLAEE